VVDESFDVAEGDAPELRMRARVGSMTGDQALTDDTHLAQLDLMLGRLAAQ
jgi:hypothetical protein